MKTTRIVLLSLLFLTMGFAYTAEVPLLKNWLLREMTLIARKQAKINLTARNLEFSAFPPALRLIKVRIEPLGKTSENISTATVDSVSISLNATSLLSGRFEIGHLTIDGPIASIFIRTQPASEKKTKNLSDDLWDQLIRIPIEEITVQNGDVQLSLEPLKAFVRVENFSLSVEKNYAAALLRFNGPVIKIKKADQPIIVETSAKIDSVVEREAIEVREIRLGTKSSMIVAHGVARGDLSHMHFPFINGSVGARIKLSQAKQISEMFFPDKKIPDVDGLVNVDLLLRQSRGHDPDIESRWSMQNLRFEKIHIGDIETKVDFDGAKIKTKLVRLQQGDNRAKIENFELKTGKDATFAGRLVLEHIELKKFLAALDIGPPPLHMDIEASIPCEGTISPNMKIECAGVAKGSDFRVFTDSNKTLVALKDFEAASKLTIDKEKIVFPEALVHIGKSKAKFQVKCLLKKDLNLITRPIALILQTYKI